MSSYLFDEACEVCGVKRAVEFAFNDADVECSYRGIETDESYGWSRVTYTYRGLSFTVLGECDDAEFEVDTPDNCRSGMDYSEALAFLIKEIKNYPSMFIQIRK